EQGDECDRQPRERDQKAGEISPPREKRCDEHAHQRGDEPALGREGPQVPRARDVRCADGLRQWHHRIAKSLKSESTVDSVKVKKNTVGNTPSRMAMTASGQS